MAQDFYYSDVDFATVDRCKEIGERLGKTPAQVGLAWLLHQPGVDAPIVGATKLPHLEQACEAVDIELSEEDLAYLGELYQPKPILGHR
jgi:aryl-alcohol dehydrogenase (NADP+)